MDNLFLTKFFLYWLIYRKKIQDVVGPVTSSHEIPNPRIGTHISHTYPMFLTRFCSRFCATRTAWMNWFPSWSVSHVRRRAQRLFRRGFSQLFEVIHHHCPPNNPPIRRLFPGEGGIGGVRLDFHERTVWFARFVWSRNLHLWGQFDQITLQGELRWA